jgi:adenosylhomocysteinase
MDMSFATQALEAEHVVKNAGSMSAAVYNVPVEIENIVCTLKLKSMGISIDKLTPEQVEYLAAFGEGT